VPQPKSAEDAATAILTAEQRRRRAADNRPSLVSDPAVEIAETLRELQSASQDASVVRVQYVAADGTEFERELNPLDLAAGVMRAIDRSSAQVLSIPLARISSVWPVVDGH
jgi:predicted DNA-binding transcriptional regulator YafY